MSAGIRANAIATAAAGTKALMATGLKPFVVPEREAGSAL